MQPEETQGFIANETKNTSTLRCASSTDELRGAQLTKNLQNSVDFSLKARGVKAGKSYFDGTYKQYADLYD